MEKLCINKVILDAFYLDFYLDDFVLKRPDTDL